MLTEYADCLVHVIWKGVFVISALRANLMGGAESWNKMTDKYPGNSQLLCLTIGFHSCTVPTKTFIDLTPIRRSFYVIIIFVLCSPYPPM